MTPKHLKPEDLGLCPVKNMSAAARSPPAKSYDLPVEQCVISRLPFPATDSGEFKSIDDMTVKELMKFISVILDVEHRRTSRSNAASPPHKPEWWPSTVPYPAFFTILRQKTASQAHEVLIGLLRQCYEAAECSLVLDFADYMCNDGSIHYTQVVHTDRTVSVHEACGRLVASVSAENRKFCLSRGDLEKNLSGFSREVLHWSQGPSRRRVKHNFVKLFPTPPVLDLTLSDDALYDEPDYTLIDFSSPLGRHVLRHSTLNAGFNPFVSFLENERFCSTNPKIVKESVAASQRLPMPGSRGSNGPNTRYSTRRRRGIAVECRDYCFTAEEERERTHSLLTGMNVQARSVFHECQAFSVDLGKDVCEQYVKDMQAERIARFRGGRQRAVMKARNSNQSAEGAQAGSEREPQPCSSASLSPASLPSTSSAATSSASVASPIPSTSSAVTDAPGPSTSAPGSSVSAEPIGAGPSTSLAVLGAPSTSANALPNPCASSSAPAEEEDESLLSDPDEPGPATVKREAAIRKNVPPEEALSSFPKVIIERHRETDPNAPKRSRILASLMQDECKELKSLGLGELLQNQTRQTRHSELKLEAAPPVRKRRRVAKSTEPKMKREEGADACSEDQSAKRASLPAAHVPVDENKPVDEQTPPESSTVECAEVTKEERVLREKEARVNGVQKPPENKPARGRPRRAPRTTTVQQVDPAAVLTQPRNRLPRSFNLPAASNTRSKTASATLQQRRSPNGVHQMMYNDGGEFARKRLTVVEQNGRSATQPVRHHQQVVGGRSARPVPPPSVPPNGKLANRHNIAASTVTAVGSATPVAPSATSATATATMGRRSRSRVEGRRHERRRDVDVNGYSSSSDSDFQFESSCSTCSSSDSELDASIYTETSGSCRSCAEAAVWEKFVDSKGNLFYVNSKPSAINADNRRNKTDRDWKKTAGKRLKSFLKRKESNGASTDGRLTDPEGRFETWLRVAKKVKGESQDDRSLLEGMFGIMTTVASPRENHIAISDLVPESAAAASGKINRGDRLVAVNNEPVTPRNVEDILGACARKKQKKVKLTFVSAASLKVENPLAPVFKSTIDPANIRSRNAVPGRHLDAVSSSSLPSVQPSPTASTAPSQRQPRWISAWDSSHSEINRDARQQEADSSRDRGLAALFSLRGMSDADERVHVDVNRILYSYPDHLTGWKNEIAQQRGALLTLSQMASDVISGSPLISTLYVSGAKVLVTYIVEGPDVLILAVQDDQYLSEVLMPSKTADLSRFLTLEFGSLNSMTGALANAVDKEDILNRVDALFDTFFARPDSTEDDSNFSLLSDCIWDALGSCMCPALPLKLGMKTQLDSMLADYESGAWEYTVDFGSSWLRGCYIVGSALFFKGYVLASHLNSKTLEEVFLLLKFRKLLEVTWSRPVDQLVVWQPIYPSKDSSLEAASPVGFADYQKYLLVVGHGHQLLAVVLESTMFTVGRDAVSGPEYGYVQRGLKLLRQVECLRFTDVAAASLSSGVLTDGLANIDAILKNNNRGVLTRKNTTKTKTDDQRRNSGGNKPRLVSALSQPTLFPPVGPDSQRRSSMFRSHSQLFEFDSAWDSDVESSKLAFAPGRLRDVDEFDSMGRSYSRQDRTRRGGLDEPAASSTPIPSSGSRSSSYVDESVKGGVMVSLHPDDVDQCKVEYRVSRGPCGPSLPPAIFHYVADMRVRGLILCPVEGDILPRKTPAFRTLLEQFRFAVSVIRRRFRRDRRVTVKDKVVEQGMMFTLKNFPTGEKKMSSHSSAKKGYCKFWVVGRLLDHPVEQELYVCHHDAVPQDFAEIAFRLMTKITD